jgi:hypothetical protein
MTAIAAKSPAALPARPAPGQAAWREEMLGDLLKKMRDHQLPEEVAPPAPQARYAPKGQYLDVYV